jgi:hypothetical protein
MTKLMAKITSQGIFNEWLSGIMLAAFFVGIGLAEILSTVSD